jgi:hypothetical protein
MSITPYKSIESFKDHGRKKLIEGFEQHGPGESWTQYFRAYYCQFGMLMHFLYWVVILDYLTYAIFSIP